MVADEKFNVRKSPIIEVSYHTSINLAPESEWSKEESRVKLYLRDLEDDGEDKTRYFHIKMSRKEAAKLGEMLTRYGEYKNRG